jgi:hypothetical protein
MKIRVQREDRSAEVLTLKGDVDIVEGKYQNRITDGSGLDHYFTLDGFYDGWGGAVCCDEQTAAETISAMEQKREIETD